MRNSSYSFMLILLKIYRCFDLGLKMCMCFGYYPQIIFVQFKQVRLSLFSVGTLCARFLLPFYADSFKLRRWKCCFLYYPQINICVVFFQDVNLGIVKVLPWMFVGFICNTVLSFSLLIQFLMISPCMFYLKEFLSHYKIYTFSMLHCEVPRA